eukprot:11371799-Alexandrium_andersonii.AAC.1
MPRRRGSLSALALLALSEVLLALGSLSPILKRGWPGGGLTGAQQVLDSVVSAGCVRAAQTLFHCLARGSLDVVRGGTHRPRLG